MIQYFINALILFIALQIYIILHESQCCSRRDYYLYCYISLIVMNVKICTKSVHGFQCFDKSMYRFCTWYDDFAVLQLKNTDN